MRRRVNPARCGRRALAFTCAAHAGPVAGRDPSLAQARAHGDGLARGRPDDRGHPGAVHAGAGERVGAPHARPARGPGAAAPAVGRRARGARAGPLRRATSAAGRVPTSVRWSTNQGRRWGSCTPSDGTIRISDRVRGMPRWVLDYVLLHELAHLLHAGHGPDFWAELDAYPRTAARPGLPRGLRLRGRAGRDRRTSRRRAGRRRAGGRGRRRRIDEPDGVVRRGRRRRLARRAPTTTVGRWTTTTGRSLSDATARRPRSTGRARADELGRQARRAGVRVLAQDLGQRAVDLGGVVDGGRPARGVAGGVVEVLGAGQQVGVVPDGVARGRARCRGRSAPTAPRRRAAGGAAARGRRGWRTSARPARRRRGGGGSSRAAPWCAAGAGARRWRRPRRPSPRRARAPSRAARARPAARAWCAARRRRRTAPAGAPRCRSASIERTASSSWSASIVMPRA